MTFPDIIGLTGVALLIITYALLQLDRIDPKGFWYSFNNLIVAILVTVSLIYTPNLASIVCSVFMHNLSIKSLFCNILHGDSKWHVGTICHHHTMLFS